MLEARETEALLREMLAEVERREAAARKPRKAPAEKPTEPSWRARLPALPKFSAKPFPFGFRKKPVARKQVKLANPKPNSTQRSDFVIGGLGILLGLTCALFPWYIFFNPEKFGPPSVQFQGGDTIANIGRISFDDLPQRLGTPLEDGDAPWAPLDLMATGTLPPADKPTPRLGLDQQPYPGDAPPFRLVHVANGRGMIEDESGLFIVQRGSTLPDSSTVTAFEQREGKWVIRTSTDKVITIEP